MLEYSKSPGAWRCNDWSTRSSRPLQPNWAASQKHSQLTRLGCTVEEAPPGTAVADGKGISVAVASNSRCSSSNRQQPECAAGRLCGIVQQVSTNSGAPSMTAVGGFSSTVGQSGSSSNSTPVGEAEALPLDLNPLQQLRALQDTQQLKGSACKQ